jgi:lipoprotein-anchoring transpeptidase ErfK/SrfK
MYWQYKAILIAVLLIIAVGLGVIIWRSLPEGVTGAVSDVAKQPFGETEAAAPAAVPDGPAEPDLTETPEAPPHLRPAGTPPAAASTAPTLGQEDAEQRLASATQQFRDDNLLAARELAQRVLKDPAVEPYDRLWYRAAQLVSEVNTIFMNSEAPCPEKVAYTVKSGDSLSRIATAHNTTLGALQRLNDLDPTNPIIYPGSVLYMLNGDWSIHVDKSEFVLLLMNGNDLYKLYRVGIGRQNRTPVGVFVIDTKVIHPAWTPPGKHIPYGDPENVLGTHWLGLAPVEDTSKTLKGYGIHGTWEPDTVGTAASAGCVRMVNEEVAELFDFIPMPRANGRRVRVVIED